MRGGSLSGDEVGFMEAGRRGASRKVVVEGEDEEGGDVDGGWSGVVIGGVPAEGLRSGQLSHVSEGFFSSIVGIEEMVDIGGFSGVGAGIAFCSVFFLSK
ncbi:hypothetical protein Tco_0077450 [Tanacetum coccineum]